MNDIIIINNNCNIIWCLTHFTTGHRGQPITHYHHTTLTIITTINIRHDFRLQQNRQTYTNYRKADWTQFTEDTESAFAKTTIPTNTHMPTSY